MSGEESDSDERIRDIESFQDLDEMMSTVSQLDDALPYLKPLMRDSGIDVESIEDALQELDVDKSKDEVEELLIIPDRFNDLFASEGWICYDMMNLEVAKEAVETAERDGVEAGEEVLIEYYDAETVEQQLNWMKEADAFMPRIELAQKALKDYAEERYHACVPVVLSIMDGIVIDAHWEARNQPTGLFYGDPDLQAWDSMTAHINGLERLKSVLTERRTDLETDEIRKPFRNGILHGRDLGYDNKIVAAKTWAALFAVREWVLKAERDELDEPEDQENPSLADAIRKRDENEKFEKHDEEWEPRGVSIGDEIPAQGTPEEYDGGTPEHAVVDLLTWWEQNNYKYMSDYMRNSGESEVRAEEVRGHFSEIELESFRLIDISEESTMADVTVELQRNGISGRETGTVTLRMLWMDENENVVVRGHGGTHWVTHAWMKLISPF
ncbi:hypothetical protein ACFQE1_01740 [Halobium palmae]|uniref:Uncharacterized protein n=1 Tax=Halobium palmae TaxID=1776492 RepID=A0ABD5RVF7_9EURY